MPWQAASAIQQLYVDLDVVRGSFSGRRNVLKYELTQRNAQLQLEATQALQLIEGLRDITDVNQVLCLTFAWVSCKVLVATSNGIYVYCS